MTQKRLLIVAGGTLLALYLGLASTYLLRLNEAGFRARYAARNPVFSAGHKWRNPETAAHFELESNPPFGAPWARELHPTIALFLLGASAGWLGGVLSSLLRRYVLSEEDVGIVQPALRGAVLAAVVAVVCAASPVVLLGEHVPMVWDWVGVLIIFFFVGLFPGQWVGWLREKCKFLMQKVN